MLPTCFLPPYNNTRKTTQHLLQKETSAADEIQEEKTMTTTTLTAAEMSIYTRYQRATDKKTAGAIAAMLPYMSLEEAEAATSLVAKLAATPNKDKKARERRMVAMSLKELISMGQACTVSRLQFA